MGARVYRRAVVLGGGGGDRVALGTRVGAALSGGRPPGGGAALAADTMPAPAWVLLVSLYLRTHRWPGPALGVTAVDVEDGSVRLFRAADAVPVTRAVAASTAVPQVFPPVLIQGRRYMDGGTRTATNADLAA